MLVSFCLKNGSIAKNANAGKKCSGTARPGNNSGASMSNGKLMLIGPSILAKDKTIIARFKMPVYFSLLNWNKSKYPIAIRIQPNIDEPTIEPLFIILSKDAFWVGAVIASF